MNPHFASLIIGLAQQADQALSGKLPPGAEGMGLTDGRKVAQTLIDTMAMLEQKTTGQLDEEERKLLTEALTMLRFKFVSTGTK
ncbi:MAG: DUF1844 domain-containing protein [Gemmatimonadales bacterium]